MIENLGKEKRIKIAESALFYLKNIKRKVNNLKHDIIKEKEYNIIIYDESIKYCWEAIETVRRYYRNKNIDCSLTRFYKSGDFYCYYWNFKLL